MRSPYKIIPWPNSPFYYVRFYVHGKRRVFSTEETDLAAAKRKGAAIWLQETAGAGSTVQAADRGALTLANLCDTYEENDLRSTGKRRGKRYEEGILSDLVNHLLPAFTLPQEVTATAWDQHLTTLHEDGLTWRSLQRVTSSARGFLRYCVKLGALPAMPTLRAPSNEDVRREQADRRALTTGERDALLLEIGKQSRFAWRCYVVMFWSAMRQSEVEKLRLRWVDRKASLIRFPAPHTKSKKPGQDLGIHPRVLEAITEQLAERGNISPDEPLFGEFDFRLIFLRAVAAAGIDPHGLTAHHVARHTCITHAAEAGASFAEIMALGRWNSPQMAMRYMHPSGALSASALARF